MTGLGSSCGACKFLRRRCTSDCIFAPYFSYEQAASHFSAVHKVFGASNVSKLLLHLPAQNRSDAAITVSYEALARMRDPIYGCVAHIFALQQQVSHQLLLPPLNPVKPSRYQLGLSLRFQSKRKIRTGNKNAPFSYYREENSIIP